MAKDKKKSSPFLVCGFQQTERKASEAEFLCTPGGECGWAHANISSSLADISALENAETRARASC